jgi:hypothetical protein
MKRDLITTVKGEEITAANAAALSGKTPADGQRSSL